MTHRPDLAAIRQAHRYAGAYQARLMEALNLIRREFEELGLGFKRWDCMGMSNPTGQTTTWPNYSVRWGIMPLSSIEIYFRLGEENRPGFLGVSVRHIVDTAEFDINANTGGDLDPLKLGDPAAASTLLRVYWSSVANGEMPFTEQQWDMEWPELLAEEFNEDAAAICPLDQTVSARENASGRVGFAQILIEDAPTPEAFREKFLDPVLACLREQAKRIG